MQYGYHVVQLFIPVSSTSTNPYSEERVRAASNEQMEYFSSFITTNALSTSETFTSWSVGTCVFQRMSCGWNRRFSFNHPTSAVQLVKHPYSKCRHGTEENPPSYCLASPHEAVVPSSCAETFLSESAPQITRSPIPRCIQSLGTLDSLEGTLCYHHRNLFILSSVGGIWEHPRFRWSLWKR